MTSVSPDRQHRWRQLLARHLPRLAPGKGEHVLAVVACMDMLLQCDHAGLLSTFRPEMRSSFEPGEYQSVIRELFDSYSLLPEEAQAAFQCAVIFHDAGSVTGERSWTHDKRGAEYSARMLRQIGEPEQFIARVAFLIERHGLPGNIGVDILPQDLSALSSEELLLLRLIAFCDQSGRTGGNPFTPRRYQEMKEQLVIAGRQDFFLERIGRRFCPALFVDKEESARVLGEVMPLLQHDGALPSLFQDNFNLRLRINVFDLFRRTAGYSIPLYARLLQYVNDQASRLTAADVFVDTDIDFMGLPAHEREPFVRHFADRLEHDALIVRTRECGGAAQIMFAL